MPDGDLAQHTLTPEKPRTLLASKRPTSSPELPSVEALARHRKACSIAGETLETLARGHEMHTVPHQTFDNADALTFVRANVLRDLMTTLPARTLADAVAQIGLCLEIADLSFDDLESGAPIGPEAAAQMKKSVKQLFRLATSIYPVVVAASGVDPADIVDEWALTLWDRQFGALDQVMGDAA